MYTTVAATHANTGNGSYGTHEGESLGALEAMNFSDVVFPPTTIADVSGLMSSLHHAAHDGTFDLVQSMDLKDETMDALMQHRASCPAINAAAAETAAQPRSSCPLIKVTPAPELPARPLTMADLTMLNGNTLAPPTMFDNPTFAMESLMNTMPGSGSEWSDVTSDASLSSFDERGSPHSDFDYSDDLSALSVRAGTCCLGCSASQLHCACLFAKPRALFFSCFFAL